MGILSSPTTRIFRATPVSTASIRLAESSVTLVGKDSNFVNVDDRGTSIRGPQSWISMGPQRRLGGFWVHQLELIDMIPETIITPFPNIMPMPPLFAMAAIAKDMAFFASLLA